MFEAATDSEKIKVYIYKMTVDVGAAPCVTGDILSLAICKPLIRSTAKRDNVILGFAANSLCAANSAYKDNCLVYIARVTKNLSGREYFAPSPYAARPDCIYRWDGRRFERKSDALFHPEASDLAHDLGTAPDYNRAHVLLSERSENFRYFGPDCPVGYKGNYSHLESLVEQLGQGFRVHNFGPELRDELRRFIERLWEKPSEIRRTAVPDKPCRDKCRHDDEDHEIVDC
jgi:hypothetical protein